MPACTRASPAATRTLGVLLTPPLPPPLQGRRGATGAAAAAALPSPSRQRLMAALAAAAIGAQLRSAYAVRMQSPPAARIFFSASEEKNLAFTTSGCAGSSPLPRT